MEPHWGDRSKAISTFLGGIAQGHLHLQHPNQRCAPRKKQSFENWQNLWGKVDSNPLKFRRQLQQRNPNFTINICLTLSHLSKSVDVNIYSSTEWTGGRQDNFCASICLAQCAMHIPDPKASDPQTSFSGAPPRGVSLQHC